MLKKSAISLKEKAILAVIFVGLVAAIGLDVCHVSQSASNPASVTRDNHSKSPNSDPPCWHKLLLWPEGITAWAIIATLFVIGWQAWETRRSADATNNAAQAALLNTQISIRSARAWIVIKVESAGKNKFHFKAVNVGGTPANIISIRGFPRVVRLNRVEPPLDNKEGESLLGTPPCLLPATADCTALFCNIEELRGTDSVEDFLRYLASGLFEIWFYGRVVYFDVLETAPQTPHQTDWFFLEVASR